MRAWLREALEIGDYDVLEGANGRNAMDLLTTVTVDLVITDLAMPEQEGIETIRLLRRQHPGLKIIAIFGAFGRHFCEWPKPLVPPQRYRNRFGSINYYKQFRTS
jgi:chemotaxis response regulator CheB